MGGRASSPGGTGMNMALTAKRGHRSRGEDQTGSRLGELLTHNPNILASQRGAEGLVGPTPSSTNPTAGIVLELVSVLPTREQHRAAGATNNRKEDSCHCLNELFPPE